MSIASKSRFAQRDLHATIHHLERDTLANGDGNGYDSNMDARIEAIEKKVDEINTELKSFKKWYVGTALTLLLICTAIVSTYTMFIIHASNNNFELSMQMLERLGNQTTDIATMKKDIEALKQRR